MSQSCYWNHEVNCTVGPLVVRHPDLIGELHCSKCGWNPDVERARREEVKLKYGTQLQSPVHGGN